MSSWVSIYHQILSSNNHQKHITYFSINPVSRGTSFKGTKIRVRTSHGKSPFLLPFQLGLEAGHHSFKAQQFKSTKLHNCLIAGNLLFNI